MKTHEQFVSEIAGRGVVPLEQYRGAHNKILFHCLVCGNAWSAEPHNVRRGSGCVLCGRKRGIPKARISRRKENKIIADHGDWLEIDVSTRKHPDAVMLVDKIDWESLLAHDCGRWTATQNKYVVYAVSRKDGVNIFSHRVILPGAVVVDHINHNGLDNRRINIVSCTQRENILNSRRFKAKSSKYKGVSWSKRKGKWAAYSTVKGKQKHIGYYNSEEKAHHATGGGK
jgi:hypothetical protein